MLTLASKLKRDDGVKGPRASNPASDSTRRVSVRDKLLVKGNQSLCLKMCCPIISMFLPCEGVVTINTFKFVREKVGEVISLSLWEDPLVSAYFCKIFKKICVCAKKVSGQ
uniref:Uncharacterized protein n=1 Tax=Pelusios castaneus TaxID=367368 RepID=A0A8C8SN58_9SAUR